MSDIEFKFISNGINLRLAAMGGDLWLFFAMVGPRVGIATDINCQQLLRRDIRQLLTMSEVMESQISLMRLKPILRKI